MAAGACIVAADTDFTWDGATQHLARGTLIHVMPGSALEEAIGRERLVPLYGAPPVVTAAAQEEASDAEDEAEAPAASARSRGRAAKAVKDGGSDQEPDGSDPEGTDGE